jgi:hypothetical protein
VSSHFVNLGHIIFKFENKKLKQNILENPRAPLGGKDETTVEMGW